LLIMIFIQLFPLLPPLPHQPPLAARCAQVLGTFVAFALDQPQAQPPKIARHRVEGRRVASSLMYVSAQPPPNRTGNSSLHPAFPHSFV
jgi:hypothetical protein